MTADQPRFPSPATSPEIETTTTFTPKFDAQGLIPAIATDAGSGSVLMFAWMNAEALTKTIATGKAHFWSRSRKKLWLKGEDSGNLLEVTEIRTDCDQDVLWLSVNVLGPGNACHTGERSCFYRVITQSSLKSGEPLRLERIPDAELN